MCAALVEARGLGWAGSLQGSTMGVTLAPVPRVLSAVIKSKQRFTKPPSPNKHPAGPAKSVVRVMPSRVSGSISALDTRLPLLQPSPVISTQEGPAGHMHSCWGAPASHSSVPRCISHFTSQTQNRSSPVLVRPPCHPLRLLLTPAEAFSLTGWGAWKEPREPMLRHRLSAHGLTAVRGRNCWGASIESTLI